MTRENARIRTLDWMSRYSAASTLAIVLVFAAVWAPSFYTPGNLRGVLIQSAVLGIVVLGQTTVLLVRGLDMSISAIVAVMAVLVVSASGLDQAFIYISAAFAIAVAVGVVNGWLVVRRGVPPFIATYVGLIVVGGAILAYTRGQSSGSVPDWTRALGVGTWSGVPIASVVWLCLVGLVAFALTSTTWGRWVYSVGSNAEASRHAGVPVGVVTMSAYVISAVCAAIAGLLLSGYLGYVDQTVGTTLSLNSVGAAIIGGVAFSGGRGGVLGATVGAVLITVLTNVVVVAGLPVYWQYIIVGVALAFAVTTQGLRDRWMRDR